MRPVLRAALPGAGALAVLGVGAAVVCPGGQCAVPSFDAEGMAVAAGMRAGWLDKAALLITWGGSLGLLLPVALALDSRHARHRGWLSAAFATLSLLAAATLAHMTKLVVLRPRPEIFPSLADMPADASFPSAHAMQISAFVAALLLRPGARPAPVAWAAGAALVAAVALSRVHLQVHFPSDVIAGILAGTLLAVALRAMPPWRGAAS